MSDKPHKPDTYPGFLLDWKGVKWLAYNGQPKVLMPQAVDDPKIGHEAVLWFFWDGTMWTFHLDQTKFNDRINLARIADEYGGSGAKSKATFTVNQIPFPLYRFR